MSPLWALIVPALVLVAWFGFWLFWHRDEWLDKD